MKAAMGWFVPLQMCTAPSPPRHGCQKVTALNVPAAASKQGLKYIHVVGEKHKGFEHTFMKI